MICWKCHKTRIYERNTRESGRNVPVIVCKKCAEKIFGKMQENELYDIEKNGRR